MGKLKDLFSSVGEKITKTNKKILLKIARKIMKRYNAPVDVTVGTRLEISGVHMIVTSMSIGVNSSNVRYSDISLMDEYKMPLMTLYNTVEFYKGGK